MSGAGLDRTDRPSRRALGACVLVLLVALSPLVQNWREEPVDGFPLSYYPMFTTVRNGRTTLTHPIGIRADASTVDLEHRTVGTGGMNQVRRQIRRLVRAGQAEELCARVAARAVERGTAAAEELVAVAIVRDRYGLDAWFQGEREPLERKELARVELDGLED